jgi:hypothetical protein
MPVGSQADTASQSSVVGPLKGRSNPRTVASNLFEVRKESSSAVKHGLAIALMRPQIPFRFWEDCAAASASRVGIQLRHASIAVAVVFFAWYAGGRGTALHPLTLIHRS